MARVPIPPNQYDWGWYRPGESSGDYGKERRFLSSINMMLPYFQGTDIPWVARHLHEGEAQIQTRPPRFGGYLEAPTAPVKWANERERLEQARGAIGSLNYDWGGSAKDPRAWLYGVFDLALDFTKGQRRTRAEELRLGKEIGGALGRGGMKGQFAPFLQRLIMPSWDQAPPGTTIYDPKSPRGVWTVPNPSWY